MTSPVRISEGDTGRISSTSPSRRKGSMLPPRARSRSALPRCKKGPARSATRTAGSGRGLSAVGERSGGARAAGGGGRLRWCENRAGGRDRRGRVVEEGPRPPLAVEFGVGDRAGGDRQSRGDR